MALATVVSARPGGAFRSQGHSTQVWGGRAPVARAVGKLTLASCLITTSTATSEVV